MMCSTFGLMFQQSALKVSQTDLALYEHVQTPQMTVLYFSNKRQGKNTHCALKNEPSQEYCLGQRSFPHQCTEQQLTNKAKKGGHSLQF